MIAAFRYRPAALATELIASNTPSPGWDAFGHVYLLIEQKVAEDGAPSVKLEELKTMICEYNVALGAELPEGLLDIAQALLWLTKAGLVEAV